jgi:adenosyl cobinamide kinase/adenosyl cobinamide phosphate guanylyltransferase
MQEINEKIKQWVTIDTQLKIINEKTKEIRNKKALLLDEITNYIQENNMKNKTIEISDGSLKFYEKKEYAGLTYAYIEECLGKIIMDKKHVEHIMNYLRENRPIKTSMDIKRNYTKENK